MYEQKNNNPQLDLIYDDVNVSESNWLKDVLEIGLKLIMTLVVIYAFIYLSLGIIISNLNIDKQIALENLIAGMVDEQDVVVSEQDNERFNRIKENILSYLKNVKTLSI
jgi:hypothetical protein